MDYKAYALMAILLASVASVALIGVAHAQATTLTVQTDKTSYKTGDQVTITGKLTATSVNQPVLVQLFNPAGGFIRGDPVDTAPDGSFTYKFMTGGPLMSKSGTYKVTVSYKGTTQQSTTFDFTSTATTPSGNWLEFTLKQGNKIQYMITGGTVVDMVADDKLMTLTVTINSTSDGNLKIRLPRDVIDSRGGADGKSGNDTEFGVFIDDVSQTPNEIDTSNTATFRTLSIDFDKGTQQIEIVGTWAIPEFGAIAAIILAAAIVGIIVATATVGKKFNFAPRL